MEADDEWHVEGALSSGLLIERGDRLAYAKQNGIGFELLASKLAQLVGVPVPHVELGTIKAVQFAISDVHGSSSRPLASKAEPKLISPSEPEKSALRRASGLLSFLVWISATDHLDDTNLVLDEIEPNLFAVRAIDFEHAFSWPEGPDVIGRYAPPSIVDHRDPKLVENSLEQIESLTNDQIAHCVALSGVSPSVGDSLTDRRDLLRGALESFDWLRTSSV